MIILVLPHLYLSKTYHEDDLNVGYMSQKDNMEKLEISGMPIIKTIKLLQSEPFVVSFLGGITGKHIKKVFTKNNIKSEHIYTRSDTELKVNILDNNNKSYAVIGENAKNIMDKEYAMYKSILNNLRNMAHVVIINESFFKSNEKEFYADILKFYKNDHYKIIVNTDKYSNILDFSDIIIPYAIKVTISKDDKILEKSNDEIVKKYLAYIKKGIHYVAIDIAGKGAIFISKNKTCYIESNHDLPSEKISEAIDAFLGAIAVGIERKYEQEKMSKIAFGTSVAVLQNKGISYCKQNDIMINKNKFKISEINNKNKISSNN
ncbi:MAG: hypothetical protein A2Y18_01200 [Clostridiales bacterium GWD2_32_19]|nr:MAG: hypothetical protein A2Y18_01200 [Clostridiales bacterium GWD2_32_19]